MMMSIYMKNYNKKQCINCGTYGHTIRLCNSPITSYGIITYTITDNTIKYLMIQRKNSLTYIEFIRGKYTVNMTDYIEYLLINMTIEERALIKNNTIEELWKLSWTGTLSNRLNQEFKDSKIKYYKLKEGYQFQRTNNTIEYIDLDILIDKINTEYPEKFDTEWEFPKGRRNLNESDIECAFREFEEESGISCSKVSLCNFIKKPIEEIYVSPNKTRYKHVYYIGNYYDEIKSDSIFYNTNNAMQCKEVKDVKWMTYEEILEKLRYNQVQRTELLKRVHKQLISHLNTNKSYNIIN